MNWFLDRNKSWFWLYHFLTGCFVTYPLHKTWPSWMWYIYKYIYIYIYIYIYGFSGFVSLIQLRLFSTFQLRSVRQRARAQSGVTSCSTSTCLFGCPLVSLWVEIFPDLYNYLDAYANPCGHTFHRRVDRRHTTWLACHSCNLSGTYAEETPAMYLLKETFIYIL